MDRKPSSGRLGFFQTAPALPNQFLSDECFRRVVNLFLPKSIQDVIFPDLERFGNVVLSKQVLDWISDAERNPPYLRGFGYDSFGNRTDQLVTSEGWRCLQDMGFREGQVMTRNIVANGYDGEYGEYNRMVQFVKYHLWSASNANVTCPSAMQDGAAAVLRDELARGSYDTETRGVLREALKRLTSRDPAVGWTSGQWMTERKGGSNVSGTETLATQAEPVEGKDTNGLPLGPWRIDGFKWFSSATDCSMAILLAQTVKGLSCFLAPTRRVVNGREEMNGVRLQRLKSKMGTRPLPTAELELEGMRAFLLGEEGRGVKVISGLLNITRVHNSVTAVGCLGRGLAIARAYALERKAGDRLLRDIYLYKKTLARQFQEYRANMLLAYFVLYLLGLSENKSLSFSSNKSFASRIRPKSFQQAQALLRVLTSVTKALTAKAAIYGLQEAMEALGGVGYLENEESQNINIARLFRDTNVLSIWEGTTDVMATDTVKVLKSRDSATILDAITRWVSDALTEMNDPILLGSTRDKLYSTLETFEQHVASASLEELTANGREVVAQLGNIVCYVLLIVDAASDNDEAAQEICLRFAEDRLGFRRPHRDWKTISRLDGLIAFGREYSEAMSKL